jgi:hypothetical protein
MKMKIEEENGGQMGGIMGFLLLSQISHALLGWGCIAPGTPSATKLHPSAGYNALI